MKTDLEVTRKNVTELGSLDEYAYETIFKMYKDQDQFFAYNILKNVRIPSDLDNQMFYYYTVAGQVAWTHLSNFHYGTIQLWWLICLSSGIKNPVELPEPGTILKIIKPMYVREILDSISAQVNR